MEVEKLGKDTARQTQIAAANLPSSDVTRADQVANAARLDGYRAQSYMLESAKPLLAIGANRFDQNPYLLNVANGVVDLRTGELMEHDRGFLMRLQSPVAYEAGATDPKWEKVLRDATEGNEDYMGYLQMVMGSSITGLTVEELIFVALGKGQSGKSTILDGCRVAIGTYGAVADSETFLSQKFSGNGNGPTESIMRLEGRRLVTVSEVDEGRRFRSGLLKWASGGDTMAGRSLYQSTREFKPQFTLWFGLNDFPELNPGDTGARRRIIRLPFNHVVPPEERDNTVKAHLTNPQGGGPAVLAWLIEGARRYFDAGKLEAPDFIQNATTALWDDQDPIKQFLVDECEIREGHTETVADLWSRFEDWQREAGDGYAYLDKRKFSQRMEERGFTKTRGTGGKWVRKGLKLYEAEESESHRRGNKNSLPELPQSRF